MVFPFLLFFCLDLLVYISTNRFFKYSIENDLDLNSTLAV